MSIRFAIALLSLVAAVSLTACDDSSKEGVVTPQQTEPAAMFEDGDCVVPPPTGQLATNMRCGFLTVPEDRTSADSRAIRLAVVVLKAVGDDIAPDPIVYLSGGPGVSALESDLPVFYDWLAHPLQIRRDIVLFDQRGTGLSEPALTCESMGRDQLARLSQNIPVDDELKQATESAIRCREELLGEGANLDAYRSSETAADIHDLATALGYHEWNLYGYSYGTRVALTALRDNPDGIRSVILDSLVPLQIDNADRALDVQSAFEKVFGDCEADQTCHDAFPKVEAQFYAVVERLNGIPVSVPSKAFDGTTVDVVVTGSRFVNAIVRQFGIESLQRLPSDIYAIASGDDSRLKPYADALALNWGSFASGLAITTLCNEEIPFTTAADVAHGVDGVQPEIVQGVRSFAAPEKPIGTEADLERATTLCGDWVKKHGGAIENDPVTSDVPALLLSGGYDPATPPSNAALAAQTLSHSFVIEVPNAAHGVGFTYPLCVFAIAGEFLDSPSVEPDKACLAGVPKVAWIVP